MVDVSKAVDGALGIVADLFPSSAPFISIARKIFPWAIEARPLLVAAIKEGPDAFRAVRAAAPDVERELLRIVGIIRGTQSPSHDDVDHLVTKIIGIGPPGWTDEETQRWWDRASVVY